MTTLDQDIRSKLETAAIAVSGFPGTGRRAFEGVAYQPEPGEEWARLSIIWSDNTPRVSGATNLRTGIFQVDLYAPFGLGTADLAATGGALRTAFRAGTRFILAGGEALEILNAQAVGAIFQEADWLRQTNEIRWQVSSTRL